MAKKFISMISDIKLEQQNIYDQIKMLTYSLELDHGIDKSVNSNTTFIYMIKSALLTYFISRA